MSYLRPRFLLLCLLGGLVAAAAPAHAVSRAIVMEWEKIKGSAGYELELVRLTKAGREAPQLFTSEEANWKQELAVGNYEIRLRTIDDRGVPGDWGAASPYIVKLPAPKLLSPSAGSEIKPVPRARLHPVAIEWEAVPETKAYLVEILNASDKVVDRKRIEGLSYSRELPVGKSYRARVAALGEEDSVGEASLHAFSVMSSIQKTRLATVKLNRGRVSYESHNRQVGNIITAQPVISGVELGLEFRPRGLWDIGATINLGSIDFGLGTTSLLNVDLVVRRRIEALSGNSQVYAIGGISYAETGEIIGLSRQNFPIGKVSSVGPFLGLKRAGELTDRLGLELSGRVGLGILGVSAPNGMGVSPSISYRAEALLLYRVRENLQALLGFNYGGTSTSYKARPYTGGTEQNFAKPGDVNEISAGGLGVSLGVGWGF